ncbi:L-lactate dehydrogenase (cytochrome) [Nakaseomyces bracarensis]|uniref:L-lactate dehydrogenase (Cytochrome) n=1 Tax=Nakaseomyces bracarensis TaxID=273131 RepID=A0ABR4NUF3_9SACH
MYKSTSKGLIKNISCGRFRAVSTVRNAGRTALNARFFTGRTTGNGKGTNSRLLWALSVAAGFSAATSVLLVQQSQISNDVKIDQSKPKVSPEEVIKHNTPEDCWVVINGYVYDLSSFIALHPGGPEIIKANAGKDVSAVFDPIHAPDAIPKYIKPEQMIGPLDGKLPADYICPPYAPGETPDDIARKAELKTRLPHLDSIMNLYDFEYLASQILTKQAWAYYSSAGDDEISYRENHNAYHRIFFNPRVLVDVSKVDTTTKMLGSKVDVPFYVTATALCKLGNPREGEKDIARGCGQGPNKAAQMISTLASCSVDEIVKAAPSKEQVMWYQLYVNSDRKITEEVVKHIEELGIKAIFVTVDAPSLGSREKDKKIKFHNTMSGPKRMKTNDLGESEGAAKTLSKFIDPSLTWQDIKVLRKKTKLPIIIKGVQRVDDAVKAAEIGCQGIVLSNHGGRQLDFARAPIEVLAETMPVLKEKQLDKNFEVFVDGGVRRGSDVIKALCLGATGVGLGRPFLYANSCYGKDGVQKAIDLLKEELEMNMRLIGAQSIKDLTPDLLDISCLHNRTVNVAKDSLYEKVYVRPDLAEFLEPIDSE